MTDTPLSTRVDADTADAVVDEYGDDDTSQAAAVRRALRAAVSSDDDDTGGWSVGTKVATLAGLAWLVTHVVGWSQVAGWLAAIAAVTSWLTAVSAGLSEPYESST